MAEKMTDELWSSLRKDLIHVESDLVVLIWNLPLVNHMSEDKILCNWIVKSLLGKHAMVFIVGEMEEVLEVKKTFQNLMKQKKLGITEVGIYLGKPNGVLTFSERVMGSFENISHLHWPRF